MISTLTLLCTVLLSASHVTAEAAHGELAVRQPVPDRDGGRWRQYSSFIAENDLACCPDGAEKKAGTCCSEGLVCDVSNSTGHGPMCITIPTATNGTNTNNTGNHTTGSGSVPTETGSGAASVARLGMWASVMGLTAAVGTMLL